MVGGVVGDGRSSNSRDSRTATAVPNADLAS